MQNKTLVLAFFVLVGVVLGGLVWGTHTPSTNAAARIGRKPSAVAPEAAGAVSVAGKKAGTGGHGTQAVTAGQGVSGMPIVAGAPTSDIVAAGAGGDGGGAVDGVTVVPVSGSLNASGAVVPANRKSLIPGPDEGGSSGAQGDK